MVCTRWTPSGSSTTQSGQPSTQTTHSLNYFFFQFHIYFLIIKHAYSLFRRKGNLIYYLFFLTMFTKPMSSNLMASILCGSVLRRSSCWRRCTPTTQTSTSSLAASPSDHSQVTTVQPPILVYVHIIYAFYCSILK